MRPDNCSADRTQQVQPVTGQFLCREKPQVEALQHWTFHDDDFGYCLLKFLYESIRKITQRLTFIMVCILESPPPVRPRIRLHRVTQLTVGITASLLGSSDSLASSTFTELKKLSLEQLMDIEVTSVSRSPSPLANAPSALQVITSEEIRRSGATRLPEALRLADNLNVAQKNASGWGISARGFNTELANKLLVMIDGRTVYTPLFSGVRWDVQDYLLEDIDRIEVISGPGGSLWGANAVNGVINVTSKAAADTQGFYGEVGAGNQLEHLSSVRYGGRLGNSAHFRIYAKRTERASEVLSSGAEVNDGTTMSQIGFRVDTEILSGNAFTVQGDYYRGHVGIPRAGEGKVAGGNLLTRWSRVLANGSSVQLQFYYDRTFLRQPFAPSPLAPTGSFTDNLDTYDWDFQHSIPHGESNSFVWGLGYRFFQDRTKDAPALGFRPNDLDQELFSGFVQEQFSLGEHGLLTVGTKLERNDYTGWEVIPNVRLQRDLGRDHLVWAAVSKAVRAPSRIDRDIRQPSRGLTILGGSDFDSETVVAYEAGYRGRLAPKVVGSVSVFYNEYKNIRSLSSTPVTVFPLFFGNDVEGDTHGVELSFDYDATAWWRLHGGYTFLKSDLRVRPGGQDRNNALNETSDPENQISVRSSMDLPWGMELDAHLRWVDTLENNVNGRVGTVPSYFDLNVRVGVNLGKDWELSVVGQNLLDDHHPEFGLPGVNRVEIRRSIFAKVMWRY